MYFPDGDTEKAENNDKMYEFPWGFPGGASGKELACLPSQET